MEYVGVSSDAKIRIGRHKYYLRKNEHPNYVLQEDWNKFGENVFEFIILGEGTEDDELEYQTKHNTIYPGGYNLKLGNAYGSPSELSRRKNSDSSKGKKWTPEQKAKIDHRGENNPLYGKRMSEETKRKISESQKRKYKEKPELKVRKPLSEETKRKISETKRAKRERLLKGNQ